MNVDVDVDVDGDVDVDVDVDIKIAFWMDVKWYGSKQLNIFSNRDFLRLTEKHHENIKDNLFLIIKSLKG
jgi:hypothetical protein